MKAIIVHCFGGPEVLQLEETPDPMPVAGQVLVAVKAVGVNPVETYIRSGIYGPRSFPFTPGSDSAGIVEAIGNDVKELTVGQRVYTAGTLSGAYAEKALCDQITVHPLPSHVSFEQGAAMGVPYATAHRALFHRARAEAGEIVLVHGASGGVGIAAIQLARAAGLTVIATAGSEQGSKLVRENGAHHVLDHHDDNHLAQVKELTGGKGVDIVLEMAAHLNLGKVLSVLATLGRAIVVGSRGQVEITPRDLMGRDADIRGMTLMNVSAVQLAHIHQALVAGLQLSTVRPYVGNSFPLAKAAEAHKAVMEAKSLGKIVLLP